MAVLGEFLVRLFAVWFLRFKWRNNTANNTEPKTRLKRPKKATNCAQITSKTQRQPHVKESEVYFHIHDFILAF